MSGRRWLVLVSAYLMFLFANAEQFIFELPTWQIDTTFVLAAIFELETFSSPHVCIRASPSSSYAEHGVLIYQTQLALVHAPEVNVCITIK